MDLYLSPDNLADSALYSSNGIPHYRIKTSISKQGTRVTHIQRAYGYGQRCLIGEIDWRCRTAPTMIRSPVITVTSTKRPTEEWQHVRAAQVFYKRKLLSPTRYFLGEDLAEYRWKATEKRSFTLSHTASKNAIAEVGIVSKSELELAKGARTVLRIKSATLDMDLIVLAFVFMEKKYRDKHSSRDEHPEGDGGDDGFDVGESENIDVGALGEA